MPYLVLGRCGRDKIFVLIKKMTKKMIKATMRTKKVMRKNMKM